MSYCEECFFTSPRHDADCVYGRLEKAEAKIVSLRSTLRGVAKWCHQGHGDFPAKGCGLCKPIYAALEEKP